MSLIVLKAKKLFKKNKISEELPKKSETFNKIKARINEVIEIQFNGGWKLTEKEQKIQDEFLPKLFKEMTRRKELPKKPQVLTLVPRNKDEVLEILDKIDKKFPGIIENFVKSDSDTKEVAQKSSEWNDVGKDFQQIHGTLKRMDNTILDLQIKEVNNMYQEIKEMYSEMKKMQKGEERTNEKKEKRGISNVIHPLTDEEYKELPSTFRNFFEKFHIDEIYKLPRKIRSKEIGEDFLERLKKFKRYAPSYSEKNKEEADKILLDMLNRSGLQQEKEIIDIIKECREVVKIEKKS